MSALSTINLTWDRLRCLTDFPAASSEHLRNGVPDNRYKLVPIPSVYIWGFQHDGVFIPYYVGQTPRPFERAMQHYAGQRGGLYPVYHRNCLSEFYLHKADHIDRRVNPNAGHSNGQVNPNADHGMIYTPASPFALGTHFLNSNVQQEVDYLLKAFRFTYARVPDEHGDECGKVERSRRVMVESALACQLGRSFLQATVARCKGSSTQGIAPARCCEYADQLTFTTVCLTECRGKLTHTGDRVISEMINGATWGERPAWGPRQP